MSKGLLLACLLVLALSTNFDITSTSVCTSMSAGFCTRWEQNGTVQEQLGSCFPAGARVLGRQGPIRMSDLRKGDEILGWVDGKEGFVKVTSWLHRKQEAVAEYLQLNTQDGWLQVSPKHNLASRTHQFRFAEETDSLFPARTVDSVQKVTALGLYAPKTTSNNFFVLLEGSKGEEKALAHCFAHIRNPELYETPFAMVEALWDFFVPEGEAEVHPSYKWMQ